MRNSLIGVLVLLLMGCANIVQLHRGTTDDDLTKNPPSYPGDSPPELEEISSIAPDEMAALLQVQEFSPSDQILEGEEGEAQELIVGIPGPPSDDEVRVFSEPGFPSAEQLLFGGERAVQLLPDFPGVDEDIFFLRAEIVFEDQGSSQEEKGIREPAFDIPIIINGKVEQFITYFQTRGRKVFSRWLSRSRRYIPLMKELLSEKGLPEDLVYLALIESGYNPRAYSRKKAMGLWQFRYNTGKRYGLKVDWWIDERRDPVKSTIAAALYLKHLFDRFECWYLAAAGYNAGEGKILRAIRRYKTEDFWELTKYPYLKRETKNFIPKMIAAALIAKSPEEYGFWDISYEEPIRFETVKVPDATDLRVIARASGTTYEELKRLNPELRRWCTPPNYPDYELKLPYGRKEIFLRNYSKIPPSKRITFRRHVVRSGETLSHIALRYRTNIGAIMRMNRIRNHHRIRAGRSLIIPVRGSKKFERRKMAERLDGGKDLFDSKGPTLVYTVREGDTLWDISRSAGIDVETLCRWNGIRNASRIYPGDRLRIPVDDTSTPLSPGGEIVPARNPKG